MSGTGKKKILLALSDKLLLGTIRSLFQACSDVEVVGAVTNGRAAVVETYRCRPDVVVVDAAMPELDGFDATRQIGAGQLETRIVVISSRSDQLSVTRLLGSGAAACLFRDCCVPEDLIVAGQAVCLGGY